MDNKIAIIFEKKGDLEAAISEWTRVLEIKPNPSTFCRRGLLFQKIGNTEQAIKDLKKGLKHKRSLEAQLRNQAEAALKEAEEHQYNSSSFKY